MKTLRVLVLASVIHQSLHFAAEAQPCDYDWDVSIGNPGMDREVTALAVHDDGTGPALYAGGMFLNAGGNPATRIAKWDGQSWSPLGSGIGEVQDDHSSVVFSMASFDDGSGPALYAGGVMYLAGGQAVKGIAVWRDGQWSALGLGLKEGSSNGDANKLVVFDDGSGPALYVAGLFDSAGGIPATNIARWDGQNWSPLGTGVGGGVKDMVVYNDGSGPALYLAGRFGEQGGTSIIEKWNGQGWLRMVGGKPLGSWENYSPCPIGWFCPYYSYPDGDALGIFDFGREESLILSGSFTRIGKSKVSSLAAWAGQRWSSLTGGYPSVGIVDFLSFDDGSGPALYAGGWDGIERWNGRGWAQLGDGFTANTVWAMAEHDDGSGKALYVGGRIFDAGGQPTQNIARWKCPD